eukprot:1899104-Karenia_brevis.AAC.1
MVLVHVDHLHAMLDEIHSLSSHHDGLLDENQALRRRVALQSALIQRLLADEAIHHQHSSGCAGDISFNAAIACEKGGQCSVAGLEPLSSAAAAATDAAGDEGDGHASPELHEIAASNSEMFDASHASPVANSLRKH